MLQSHDLNFNRLSHSNRRHQQQNQVSLNANSNNINSSFLDTQKSQSTINKKYMLVPPAADCDDDNTPPSLAAILQSINSLKSGSDIRGTFVDHKRIGTLLNVYQAILTSTTGFDKALTPFAAYCYGNAFAQMVASHHSTSSSSSSLSSSYTGFPTAINSIIIPPSLSSLSLSSPTLVSKEEEGKDGRRLQDDNSIASSSSSDIYICVGRDPRSHSTTLADCVCRGIESVSGCKAVYTSLATTPSMLEFCRSTTVVPKIDASIMITASHLPQDKNGLKFFANFCQGGFTKKHISILAEGAISCARSWFHIGLVPPTSGEGGVSCSSWVCTLVVIEKE